MIAKGRSYFQVMVECKRASLYRLLSDISQYIIDIKQKMEDEANSISEEYYEWDEDAQKDILCVWHPDPETDIFNDMLNDFYASLIQRVYSFAEIGMLELCRDKEAVQKELAENNSTIDGETVSSLVYYYKTIQAENGITLLGIRRIWTGFRDFHNKRNELTHKELYMVLSKEKIEASIDEVYTLLLETEKAIQQQKKKH